MRKTECERGSALVVHFPFIILLNYKQELRVILVLPKKIYKKKN